MCESQFSRFTAAWQTTKRLTLECCWRKVFHSYLLRKIIFLYCFKSFYYLFFYYWTPTLKVSKLSPQKPKIGCTLYLTCKVILSSKLIVVSLLVSVCCVFLWKPILKIYGSLANNTSHWNVVEERYLINIYLEN